MKKEIIVEVSSEKLNIKEFLESHCTLSSRKVKLLLKQKKIQINNKTAYYDSHVKNGDKVILDLSEAGRDSTIPESMDLDIIYEDEYFLAVNKPAGMLVHPTPNFPTNTLSNGLKFYFLSKDLDIPIRFINRIDRDTTGLVVIAKSGEAHSALANQFEQDSCEKIYLAVVEGRFAEAAGTIDKPIGIDDENAIRRAVREDGQKSITKYQVQEQYKEHALVRLNLITGRTHQIRVHMSSIGHPLLGDKLYGGSMQYIERQALHAYEMIFKHPYSNSEIKLQAMLPQDMQQLIELLKSKNF
jgi:23S rRNA pseudouridine1911/1915/1917 synthase